MLRTAASARLLPEARGDQQVLETYVLCELLSCRFDYTAYTLGIRSVIPRHDSLTLYEESDEHAERVLCALLPVHDPDSEVFGIAGLRIRPHADRAIELHRLGHTTSLWLAGPPASVWKRIERDKLAFVLDQGWDPIWRRSRSAWIAQEVLFHQEYYTDAYSRRLLEDAWCASGLLRRLPLFHKIGTADFIGGYIGHPFGAGTCSDALRWCFDLHHRPEIAWQATRLITAPHRPRVRPSSARDALRD